MVSYGLKTLSICHCYTPECNIKCDTFGYTSGAGASAKPMSHKSVAFYIASGNVDPMAFKLSHFYSSHRLDKNVADEVGALDAKHPMSHFEMPLDVWLNICLYAK